MENNFQSTQKMKFTKTETEYSMKSIRFLLLTITTMFIIIACLMIVLGISVHSHYHTFNFFYESAKSGRFFTPSILSVLLGMMLLIVTSFGFFGTLKQSTCMVNLYALILSLILVVKLVVVCLAFTMNETTIMEYIDIPVDEYNTDPEIQAEIDFLQISLNCCGRDSYMDYFNMDFTSNHSTITVNTERDGEFITIVVPTTCCVSVGICGRLRTSGCRASLANLIVQNSSVLGVLGVSVMFIELLGVTFALLLARCIRKLKSERALINWTIREQMMFARKANEDNLKNSVFIEESKSSVA